MMSSKTSALKDGMKGPIVIQAWHGGIPGNLQAGTTPKQLLPSTITLEHSPVENTLTWPDTYLHDQVALG